MLCAMSAARVMNPKASMKLGKRSSRCSFPSTIDQLGWVERCAASASWETAEGLIS